jgi:hypothetical protein
MSVNNFDVVILDWNNRPPVPIVQPPTPERNGVLITVCTTQSQSKAAQITIVETTKLTTTETVTLRRYDNYRYCGTTIFSIERQNVQKILITSLIPLESAEVVVIE